MGLGFFFSLFNQPADQIINNKHILKHTVPQSDWYSALQMAENAVSHADTSTLVCRQQAVENRWTEGYPEHSVYCTYTGLPRAFSS